MSGCTTPEDVLLKASYLEAKGEWYVGYAWPWKGVGDINDEYPLVKTCLRKGWIVYYRNSSPGIESPMYGQRRDLYKLTPLDRAKRRELEQARSKL